MGVTIFKHLMLRLVCSKTSKKNIQNATCYKVDIFINYYLIHQNILHKVLHIAGCQNLRFKLSFFAYGQQYIFIVSVHIFSNIRLIYFKFQYNDFLMISQMFDKFQKNESGALNSNDNFGTFSIMFSLLNYVEANYLNLPVLSM